MKISVITVCFNAVSTIASSILSVIEQDYENVEYIVIDGGSTDGTIDVISRYSANISCFISESDAGIYDAINKGINQATGDVIGLLHANDCFAANDVLTLIAKTISEKKVDAVYSNLIFCNTKGAIVRRWKSAKVNQLLLEMGWMPPHPTLYIKKEIYNRYGNYRLDFGTAADYELILRFFYRYKIKTCYIDTVFIKMLTGGISNKSILNHVTANVNDFKAMKIHRLRAPFIAIILKPLQKVFQYL
jgi:glycosyltransferase involved in cell wall biosynthesis